MTDKRLIISQLNKLHSLERKSSIKTVKRFSFPDQKLGSRVDLKKDTYIDDLNKHIRSNSNYIELFDNSIISYLYQFDNTGKVIAHNLYYIPDIIDEETFNIIQQEKIDKGNINNQIFSNYEEYFNNQLTKYLRIDYDNQGIQEYHHSPIHIHLGFVNNDLRFPFSSYLYPNEFIYLILKYFYKDSDESLSVISNFVKNKRKIKLTENEKKKFYTSLGIFHE